MRRLGFRTRLLIILALFAVVPAAIISAAAGYAAVYWLREFSGAEPWERVAETGRQALEIAESHPVSPAERLQIENHRQQLSISLTNARRLAVLMKTAPVVAVLLALFTLLVLGVATARVAGHLSRQLSRPLQELVGWTERMAHGDPLPETAQGRGASEFEVLRERMRTTSRELALGRERELEAARLRAFRESARQVAHELKNPLTPIRFAVEQLRRAGSALAEAGVREAVEVLDVETSRMEEIARNFATFGRLPEGPRAEIDVAEMIAYTARASVPPTVRVELEIEPELDSLWGHYDSLSRAMTNVFLNGVAACSQAPGGGRIAVKVRRSNSDAVRPLEIAIQDNGVGIPADRIESVWEPYVTYSRGGTGLGLAIVRQAIEAHGGIVRAESAPGEGTTIRFRLPFGEPSSEAGGGAAFGALGA